MKKFAVLALTVIFAVAVFAGQAFPLTTPYDGLLFTATFPTPDDKSIGIEKTPLTGTTTTQDHSAYSGYAYGAYTANGKAWFGLSSIEYATVRNNGVDVLDKVVDGGFAGMNATLVPDSRENTVMASLFAREAEGVTDGYDAFTRVSVIGNHMYQALVIFDKSLHAKQSDADEFFSTIRQQAPALHDRT